MLRRRWCPPGGCAALRACWHAGRCRLGPATLATIRWAGRRGHRLAMGGMRPLVATAGAPTGTLTRATATVMSRVLLQALTAAAAAAAATAPSQGAAPLPAGSKQAQESSALETALKMAAASGMGRSSGGSIPLLAGLAAAALAAPGGSWCWGRRTRAGALSAVVMMAAGVMVAAAGAWEVAAGTAMRACRAAGRAAAGGAGACPLWWVERCSRCWGALAAWRGSTRWVVRRLVVV